MIDQYSTRLSDEDEFRLVWSSPTLLTEFWAEHSGAGSFFFNYQRRQKFQRWCRQNNKDYTEWFDRANFCARLKSFDAHYNIVRFYHPAGSEVGLTEAQLVLAERIRSLGEL